MSFIVDRARRAAGAVVGSAVGDALGAPFEFGPAGDFSTRFPEPGRGGEMCGGGGWERGEATDDTQMAVHVADSLLAHAGLATTASYEEAVRAAVDLGGDTDTVAAVTGALAGARHGLAAVPRTGRLPCTCRSRAPRRPTGCCATPTSPISHAAWTHPGPADYPASTRGSGRIWRSPGAGCRSRRHSRG